MFGELDKTPQLEGIPLGNFNQNVHERLEVSSVKSRDSLNAIGLHDCNDLQIENSCTLDGVLLTQCEHSRYEIKGNGEDVQSWKRHQRFHRLNCLFG